MLDIKFPIGLMFLFLGLLLSLFGLFTMSNAEMYKASFNINVNLWSGLLMFVFGGIMLLLSRKKKK
jgi:H+/Cl- antiporter ClcA